MNKAFRSFLFLTLLLVGFSTSLPLVSRADSTTTQTISTDTPMNTISRSEAASATANARTSKGTEDVEMADVFRKEGKIYVVVGIAGVVLLGFFLYLFSIERRLAKMEDNKGR